MKNMKTELKNLIIRQAVKEDLPALCKIFQNDLGYSECTMEILMAQFSNLNLSREAVFVAQIDSAEDKTSDKITGKAADKTPVVCGVIHVEKYNLLYFPPMANLLGLAVASEYRRKGIGQALLQRAEQWAKENGIAQMRLNSCYNRTQAHDFYRSQGYIDDKMQLRFLKTL